MTKAKDILSKAETRYDRVKPHLRDAANWFHDHEGEMFERDDAVEQLATALDIDKYFAGDLVRELVSDNVDPVVQVSTEVAKYVGVVEYEEFDGAYGYVDYHDTIGKRNRVVCAQCVHESDFDHTVTHATGGDGSFDIEAEYDELVEAVHKHYDEQHDEIPDDVETGATLLSGTTIGGNTAFHAGNDGSGSGLDADTVDGQHATNLTTPSSTQSAVATKEISLGSVTVDDGFNTDIAYGHKTSVNGYRIVTGSTNYNIVLENSNTGNSIITDTGLSGNNTVTLNYPASPVDTLSVENRDGSTETFDVYSIHFDPTGHSHSI